MALTRAWRRERDDLLRGVSGGMLVGVPLLYTMEIWWRGSELGPGLMALMVVITLVPVTGLIATTGFRRTRDRGALQVGMDVLDAMALATVCVFAAVLVVGAIHLGGPLHLMAGTVVAELAPFAIGVALASVVFASGDDGDDGGSGGGGGGHSVDAGSTPSTGGDERPLNRTIADLGGTVVGAAIVGLSIAPTDEVPMLAAGRTPLGLLAIVGFSLIISYVIVFEAGFGQQDARTTHQGLFQHPVTETVASYLVALVVAAVMLAFFGRIRFDDPLRLLADHVVVLGFPACVGGAAGRLAV